jgi:hypothetical protein
LIRLQSESKEEQEYTLQMTAKREKREQQHRQADEAEGYEEPAERKLRVSLEEMVEDTEKTVNILEKRKKRLISNGRARHAEGELTKDDLSELDRKVAKLNVSLRNARLAA